MSFYILEVLFFSLKILETPCNHWNTISLAMLQCCAYCFRILCLLSRIFHLRYIQCCLKVVDLFVSDVASLWVAKGCRSFEGEITVRCCRSMWWQSGVHGCLDYIKRTRFYPKLHLQTRLRSVSESCHSQRTFQRMSEKELVMLMVLGKATEPSLKNQDCTKTQSHRLCTNGCSLRLLLFSPGVIDQ